MEKGILQKEAVTAQEDEYAKANNAFAEVEENDPDGADDLLLYEHHRVVVDGNQQAARVDVFLANRVKHLSRSRIRHAADAGFIQVNGQQVKVSYKIKPYDEVSITMPYPRVPDLRPEPVPLDIPYEDADLLIVNKQAGLVCHPGIGNYSGTLVNGLLYHLNGPNHENEEMGELISHEAITFGDTDEGGLFGLPDPDHQKIRPGLVHRIDKDTSGLLVIAKNEVAFNLLAKQFYDHSSERLYIALVWGNLGEDQGTVMGNITRSPIDRKRYMVAEREGEGKHAVTHYRVLQRFGFCTLIACRLETGRTHQIRVHMKHLGHTLFSDSFYGGHRILRGSPSKAFQRFIQECLALMPRQALHARTLGFVHPSTMQKVLFTSELPPDFKHLLLRMAQFVKLDPLPAALQELIGDVTEIAIVPHYLPAVYEEV